MGGIYKSDTGSICPTLGDAVAFNPGCTKPARFMFETASETSKRSTLTGGRRGTTDGGRSPGGKSTGMAPPTLEDDKHDYVNDEVIAAEGGLPSFPQADSESGEFSL
jgi:hypothetical protein